MKNDFRETKKFMYCGVLTLSWSISRGRDTYGYNIARLDSKTARYKCMGGGYDMTGDCLGQWLQAEYQDRLKSIAHRAGAVYSKTDGYKSLERTPDRLYGMKLNQDTGKVSLDGACGPSTMIQIAEACNISVSYNGNKRGRTIGFMYTVYESEV